MTFASIFEFIMESVKSALRLVAALADQEAPTHTLTITQQRSCTETA
jgi:hypothetical protein